MVQDLLERRRRVVVEVGRGPADPSQLGGVEHAKVGELSSQEQSARVRGRKGLGRAVGQGDAVCSGVTR